MRPARILFILRFPEVLSFILLFSLAFHPKASSATHLYGSDIGYRWIDTGIYEVRVTLLRDCNGIQMESPQVVVTDGTNMFFYMATVNGQPKDVTAIAPSCGLSRCWGSFMYGFQEHYYLDTIDLTAYNSCEWKVTITECCRNSNITTGAANQTHHNYAQLNQCLINSSPSPELPGTRLLCQNRDAAIQLSVIDTLELDDSFSYELVNAMRDSLNSTTYGGYFSPVRPLTFFGYPNQNLQMPAGFHLNSQTGYLYFRPTQINQIGVVVVEIKEWRRVNGVMQVIGITRRDMMVIIINCPNQANYKNPLIHAVDRFHEVCVKDSFCFDIQTDDPDGDSTFIDWSGSLQDGQFTTTNGTEHNAKATFCWKPINVDVSEKPYSFSIFVTDNACSIRGEYATTFFIYVRDSVDGATADAGPDIIDSTGQDSFWVEAILDDYSGQDLLWTSSGDGIFRDKDSLGSYYFPGPADKKNCLYELFFEIIDSTPCLGDSKLKDTLTVSQQIKIFDAGPDLMIYPYDTLSLNPLSDTGRAWSFRWTSSGDTWLESGTNPYTRFSQGDTDLYLCPVPLVLTAFGCDTLSDTILVERDFIPVQAGTDILSVEIDSILLTAHLPSAYLQHGYWRTTGSGSFSDSMAADATYFVHPQDWTDCNLEFIWEELPLSGCRINADTLNVSVHFTGLNAGSDQQLDLDDTVFLSAGPSIGPGPFGRWSTNGDGTFNDTNDPAAYYVPGAADKLSCGVGLAWSYPIPSCHQESDTLQVRFNYGASNAGPDQQLLFGDTLFLDGSAPAAGSNLSYWSSFGDGALSDPTDEQSRYFPGSNDWINCGGGLIWHASYPQCGEKDDTLYWTRIPSAVDAGPDQFVTDQDSFRMAALPVDMGRTQGWWTSMGDGYFSDTLDPDALYFPGNAEWLNCEGLLVWNAPYNVCSPLSDTLHWEVKALPMDAGPDQFLPMGADVVLKATSPALQVEWGSNGYGVFLDSSAKATIYYPDELDQPLCSLMFHLRELNASCSEQSDSLQVFWMEEGAEIEATEYEECFMDTIRIVLKGNLSLSYQWESDGSGSFEYDSLSGNWVYLPSPDDYLKDQLNLKMKATGHCIQADDSVQVPIDVRNSSNAWSVGSGPVIVYPNPTTDWLHIIGLCPVTVEQITVYNMLGQKVVSWNIEQLPFIQSIETLAQGNYILRVRLAGNREEIIRVTKYEK